MNAPATLITAHTRVSGDVSTEGDLVIEGHVTGSIRAAGVVRLAATAQVRGDLEAARVVIDEGAFFEGQVRLLRTANDPAARGPAPSGTGSRVVPELAAPGRRRAHRRTA